MKNEIIKDLEEIAIQIETHSKMAVEEILIVGKLLCEAREQLLSNHAFGVWRKDRLPWMDRMMVNRFMNVYKNEGSKILSLSHNVTTTILYQLTAPSTPEIARNEAIEHNDKLSVKQTEEIVKANKLIDKLQAENRKLEDKNTHVEADLDNLIPGLKRLYKGGSLVPARANQLSILTPEQQEIYFEDFEQKEIFKKTADAEKDKAKHTNEIALQAIKERDIALSKLNEAAGSTEAQLLLKQEQEKKKLEEKYQEKIIEARKEASLFFEKQNKDKILDAINAKDLAEKRKKEAVEKANAAYAEHEALIKKIKKLEGVTETKTPDDFDKGRDRSLRIIIRELAEHIQYIETEIKQFGCEQMTKTIQTLDDLEIFVHERILKIKSAQNEIITIN